VVPVGAVAVGAVPVASAASRVAVAAEADDAVEEVLDVAEESVALGGRVLEGGDLVQVGAVEEDAFFDGAEHAVELGFFFHVVVNDGGEFVDGDGFSVGDGLGAGGELVLGGGEGLGRDGGCVYEHGRQQDAAGEKAAHVDGCYLRHQGDVWCVGGWSVVEVDGRLSRQGERDWNEVKYLS